MQRLLKRSIVAVVPMMLSALALWVPSGTADLGVPSTALSGTALSCTDGTELSVALDPLSLLALTDAVTAVNLYPAGDPALACSLSTSSSSGDPNGRKDFAVGGGQLVTSICGLVNFSFSAHVANNAPVAPGQPAVGGTYNNSAGAQSLCGEGSFTSKVDCVKVTGNLVQFTSQITHSKGTPFFGNPGDEIALSARDDTPDSMTIEGGFFTSGPCNFSVSSAFLTPIARGNINVHDAS
jgi:hypothetical protein